MLGPQRRGQIVELVEHDGVIRISDIVHEFGVSRKTALRDLDLLDAEGLVDKVHGGAVAVVGQSAVRMPQTMERVRSREKLSIGMILPTRGHYNRAILRGVDAVLNPGGARLSVATTGWKRPEDVPTRLGELVRSGVDGVLLRPPPVTGGVEAAPVRRGWLEESSIPIVLIEDEPNAFEQTSAWSVATDDRRGVDAAVRHLRELGHRRIGLLTLSTAPRSRELQRAWRASLEDAELDHDVPLIDGADLASWPLPELAVLDDILQTLRTVDVTAMICHNDVPARSLADHARKLGWSIPEDLSIVAYEDRISARMLTPLTAIALPGSDVGRVAAQSLLELIDQLTGPPRRIRLEPELVVRQSTAPPRRERPNLSRRGRRQRAVAIAEQVAKPHPDV